MTDAKFRRICAPVDTGKLLLQQLPKTCQWASILRTCVKPLSTAQAVLGLTFCPGAIFTGPEGNGRHTHANALANNLVEKGGFQAVIGIHGSDLDFENSDDVYDLLDSLEKIARSSGQTVLLLDQPELSDHSLRMQNQLLRMQQSLLDAGKTLFLIIITKSAEDVAPTLLTRFPRYHCPKPNSTAINTFVDEMLKKPVPIHMEKVKKQDVVKALKNCSWKQLNDLHTQLLRLIVIQYQLNFAEYKKKELTEEQVYRDGHITLSAKAVNMVLASVMDQNAAPAIAVAGVPYVGGAATAPVTVSTADTVSTVGEKLPVGDTGEEIDPNDPIASTITDSDDPISAFMNLVGPVPQDEEEN